MNKCILLSRVSTHSQDLKQQTDELIKAAHDDGYTDDNIIIIEDKESATKLSEEERNGLNELKKHINTDSSICCVYVYEVSRIARKEKILHSIRDYLVDHKVQLIVLKPYMVLLDEEYKITQSSRIIFAMYCALSESEIYMKNQRVMRGKISKAQKGNCFLGGPVLFGYKVEHKKIILDEQKANVVRKMFEMYAKGESLSAIASELCLTGELENRNWKRVYTHIHKLLKRHEYYGGHGITKYTNYPPIIDKMLFDKVQQLLHMRSRPHSKIRHIYYAHKLLRCRKDKHCFSPTISNCCYKYSGDIYIKNEQKTLRVVAWNINMNLVDSILWHYAIRYHKKRSAADLRESKRELENKIQRLDMIIKKGKRDIEKYEKSILIANERVVFGTMSGDQGDRLIEKCKHEIEKLNEANFHNETSRFNMSCQLNLLKMGRLQKNVENVVDEKERYDIIHQCIKSVLVDKIGYANYLFEIIYSDNTSVLFETKPNNYNRVLLSDGNWEYFKRFDRFKRK